MPIRIKKKNKGRINPGERNEEATRAFDKRQQKEAAKIEMVYKLGQRKKTGKYSRPAPGASKATDTESALNTFEVQKMYDKDQKAGKGPGIDLISDRNLPSKEGSMRTGGLTGGQKKLDKNKNNRIDAEDFKILRGGRAAMKANKGKLVPLKKDPTKAISSVKPSVGGKGSGTTNLGNPRKSGENFMERRLKLKGLGKAGRIGAAAAMLGLAGAGAASLGQKIGRKLSEAKKKNKKMGGGMMKRYSKGGGADTGRVGELKSKIAVATDKLKKHFQKRKRRPDYIKPPERKPMIPANVAQTARSAESFTPTGMGRQIAKKLTGKMGGGMMSKPMGYKSGTSVKVKCKLGRNKPTKMY